MAHESPSRRIARAITLALIAAVILFWFCLEIAGWNVKFSAIGWNVGPDGTTVSYVTPGGGAERAGVRIGDEIGWKTLPLLGRANTVLVQQVRPGTTLVATIARNGNARQVSLHARPFPQPYNRVAHLSRMISQLFALFAVVLVYMRPTRMTWGFLMSTLYYAIPSAEAWTWGELALGNYLLVNVGQALVRGISAAGILIFISRFPWDRARGPLMWLDKAAPWIGAVLGAMSLYIVLDVAANSVPPPPWTIFTYQYLTDVVVTILALCGLIASSALTTGSDRQRIIPVLVTYVLVVAVRTIYQVNRSVSTDPTNLLIVTILSGIVTLALAVAVTYGIVRHRVIDISFAISRTLVYTILTGMVVGAFVLIDFLSSKFLDRLQIAVFLEAGVALAFGIWLNALHSRVDRFVDSVLFRRRHLSEARLERAGRTLVHAESAAFVDETLAIEAMDALDLASAAVFRDSGGGSYERMMAQGWDGYTCKRLMGDDHLVVTLRSELQTVALDGIRCAAGTIPEGIAHPLVAIPLALGHRLLGFVLYAGHTGGEAIDADEKRVLIRLADAAAAAYDHIQSEAIVREANELRAQLAIVQHDRYLLREIIDQLRSPSGKET